MKSISVSGPKGITLRYSSCVAAGTFTNAVKALLRKLPQNVSR